MKKPGNGFVLSKLLQRLLARRKRLDLTRSHVGWNRSIARVLRSTTASLRSDNFATVAQPSKG